MAAIASSTSGQVNGTSTTANASHRPIAPAERQLLSDAQAASAWASSGSSTAQVRMPSQPPP